MQLCLRHFNPGPGADYFDDGGEFQVMYTFVYS
jgi:hypothetical protein